MTTTLTISYGMTEPEAEARSTLDTILEQERQKVADLRAVLSSQMEPGAGLRATPTCNSTDADPRGTASSSFHVPDFSPALLVPSQHSTLVLDVECIRYAKLVLASVADLRKALPYDSTVAVLSAEYVASLPPEAAFPDEAVILGVASIPNESNQVALIRGTFMDDVAHLAIWTRGAFRPFRAYLIATSSTGKAQVEFRARVARQVRGLAAAQPLTLDLFVVENDWLHGRAVLVESFFQHNDVMCAPKRCFGNDQFSS